MQVNLSINRKSHKLEIVPNRTLMELLRAQGFWSVKHGCENGECGNCTVIVDGLAVNSCIMLAAQAEGKGIETFESIDRTDELAPLKAVLMDFGDAECGYCISGMMMSAKALVDKIRDPTVEEMLDAVAGSTCRCTQNVKPAEELLAAMKKIRGIW